MMMINDDVRARKTLLQRSTTGNSGNGRMCNREKKGSLAEMTDVSEEINKSYY